MQLSNSESFNENNDIKWMSRALELAQKAQSEGEVPVGAIIIFENEIIGEGWNQPIKTHDPTAHAEITALRNAGVAIGNYRFVNASMYVTLEPCAMCAGALVHSRIARLVYATDDPKTGACGSVFNLLDTDEFNHKVEIQKGVLEEESRSLLQAFFKSKREKS